MCSKKLKFIEVLQYFGDISRRTNFKNNWV